LLVVLNLTSLEGEVQVELQKPFFELVSFAVKVIRRGDLDAAAAGSVVVASVVAGGRATRGSTRC
jgi:hypothetical protein